MEPTLDFNAADVLSTFLAHDRINLLKPRRIDPMALGATSFPDAPHPFDPYQTGHDILITRVTDGIDRTRLVSLPFGPHVDEPRSHPVERLLIPAVALPVDDNKVSRLAASAAAPSRMPARCSNLSADRGLACVEPHFLPLLRPLVRPDARGACRCGRPERTSGRRPCDVPSSRALRGRAERLACIRRWIRLATNGRGNAR